MIFMTLSILTLYIAIFGPCVPLNGSLLKEFQNFLTYILETQGSFSQLNPHVLKSIQEKFK